MWIKLGSICLICLICIIQVLNLKVTETLPHRSLGLAKKHPDESGQVMLGSNECSRGWKAAKLLLLRVGYHGIPQ